MILICATNRPDELDESFMRPGRIDREIHIGLPGEEERISIFGVHSSGKPLAKDVDFRKVYISTFKAVTYLILVGLDKLMFQFIIVTQTGL